MPDEPVKVIGKAPKNVTGTLTRWKPDPEIFPETVHDFETIAHRLRELAYLTASVKITFHDTRPGKER